MKRTFICYSGQLFFPKSVYTQYLKVYFQKLVCPSVHLTGNVNFLSIDLDMSSSLPIITS